MCELLYLLDYWVKGINNINVKSQRLRNPRDDQTTDSEDNVLKQLWHRAFSIT